MYALGGISMKELGTQLIFDNQGQFDPVSPQGSWTVI